MKLTLLLCSALLVSCSSTTGSGVTSPVQQALDSDSLPIRAVVKNLPQHEVQVLFSEIQRDSEGNVLFVDYEFQLDDSVYFYPASTVKLPVALLALEKLQEYPQINRYSRFRVGNEEEGTNFTREIIELFVLSDNQAYNRLFEFLGKDEINRRLREKGLSARISHRLSVPESDRTDTQALHFSVASGSPFTVGPISNSPIESLSLNDLSRGRGYIEAGELVEQPFDFSEKNYLPLSSLHGVMKRLVFPNAFAESERFNLTAGHREFVLNAMSTLPKEAGFDKTVYPDSYVKFLLFGDSTEPIGQRFKIYNKVGFAYGYLTDCAYIVDTEKNREYIVSATVHVNANRVFNDDQYEYEEIGVPFLAELGRRLLAD
ncbi:MAG: serine hydrolase [Gammaproteobacteria bacterium]